MERRTARVTLLALLALGLVSGAALAAGKAAKPMDSNAQHQQMMEMMMKASMPGPMHELMKPMAGNWKTTAKSWTGGAQPEVSEGTCESAWILGNRYLQSTYKGNMAGMPFEGWGLMGYDNQKKEFVSMWADNMGTGIATSNGKADPSGKIFTMMTLMDDPQTGKPVPFKMVTKVMGENQYMMSMINMKGGKEHKEMEITYDRMK